jgi:excinuclease ABC subunit C
VAGRFGEQLAALPQRPGVYIMRDAKGQVIYVGKAANLRNRVRNYFGAPHSLEPKTRALALAVADFEYIVTNSPAEALLLEANLVKRHQPFFNIRLKDDKHYPYLKINVNEPWPRVYITRRVEKDGALYFGPYASAGSVRASLDLVKKLFPWRSCTKTITGTDPRPCLDYFIKRCIAPCTSYCTKEEYDEVIQQVVLFLEGKADDVLRQLKQRMAEASDRLDFEEAARIRDQVRAVERTTERQMMQTVRAEDIDAFGLTREEDEAVVHVFFVRGAKVVGRDNFRLAGVREEADAKVLGDFLMQFYESAQIVPKTVLVPLAPEEAALIQESLSQKRGSNVEVRVAVRGEKRRLVELATENAKEFLAQTKVKALADSEKKRAALSQLQDALDLPELPRRIECYDISNIQGTNSVASMVVFVDGQPKNSEYRRFRIRTVEGANDFASMNEVLRRRFARAREHLAAAGHEARGTGHGADGDEGARSAPLHDVSPEPSALSPDGGWADLPELVIVDGGKGQLAFAVDAMRDLGVAHIPVAGLAKKREELFVQDHDEPIVLPRDAEALYLVQRIRDEAHRFAITYHRDLRGKAATHSALDSIPGVGPKRKKALLRKFGSVKAIREASVEDIASTVGLTRATAQKLKELL